MSATYQQQEETEKERELLEWEALDRVARGQSTLQDAQYLAWELGSRWKPQFNLGESR